MTIQMKSHQLAPVIQDTLEVCLTLNQRNQYMCMHAFIISIYYIIIINVGVDSFPLVDLDLIQETQRNVTPAYPRPPGLIDSKGQKGVSLQ